MPYLVSPIVAAGTLSQRPQPTVDGHGVCLRPWGEPDIPALIAAYNDPEIVRWHTRTLADAAEARGWLDERRRNRADETGLDWAVVDPGEPTRVLGRAALRAVELNDGTAELGYWTTADARGRGVASNAARALAEWSFGTLGLHRLALLHSTHNDGSCRVAIRAGFALEGTRREGLCHADGWHDMHVHARIATD